MPMHVMLAQDAQGRATILEQFTHLNATNCRMDF